MDQTGSEQDGRYGIIPPPTHIQNALVRDYLLSQNAQENLEIESLAREYPELDKKIATELETLRATLNKSEKLDQQIFEAFEMEQQIKARLKTTEEFINVLKEETDELQTLVNCEALEPRPLEFTEKGHEINQNRQITEEYEHMKELEAKITELLNNPKLSENENLIKENGKIKNVLQEKKKIIQMKRAQKKKIEEMIEERLNLLKKIDKRQEENRALKDELEKINEDLTKSLNELKAVSETRHADLKHAMDVRTDRIKQLAESKENCRKEKLKLDALKEIIWKKEKELQNFREMRSVKQHAISEGKSLQKVLEMEIQNISYRQHSFQWQIDQAEQKIFILGEKRNIIEELRMKREVTARVYDLIKHTVPKTVRQMENNIGEQPHVEHEEVVLKPQKAHEELEDCSVVFEEKQKEMREFHEEEGDNCLKQQNFHNSAFQFIQRTLQTSLEEVNRLKNAMKELEAGNESKETSYERRMDLLNKIKEDTKKDKLAYQKLVEKSKQVLGDPKSLDGTEARASQSSSGLPGILKNQLTAAQKLQEPKKRVTFDGISEGEPSASSITSSEFVVVD